MPTRRAIEPSERSSAATGPETQSGLDAAQREELGKIFEEQNHALISFLRPMLKSSQEAMDVAQEAYLHILRRPHINTISFLRGYLFRTAANLASNRRQQLYRRNEIDQQVWVDTGDTAHSPERSYAAQVDLRVIISAMKDMPPEVVRAFVLVKLRELSFEEAAREMRCNARYVYRYVERALEHFRMLLEGAR